MICEDLMCSYAAMKPDVNHDQRTAATLTKGLGAAGATFCDKSQVILASGLTR